MSRWVTYKSLRRFFMDDEDFVIPSHSGVYVFYGDGRPVYIGETQNLYKRISEHEKLMQHIGYQEEGYSHDTPWGKFSNIYLKYRKSKSTGEEAMIERRLIKRLPYTHNIRYSNNVTPQPVGTLPRKKRYQGMKYRVTKTSINRPIATRQQVRMARFYYGFANMPVTEIAREVNLGECATRNIVLGITFKGVC